MSSTTSTLSSEPSASPTQAPVAVGFVAGAAKIDVGLMSLAFSMASLLLIGGYGSSPPQAWYLKLILYVADVSIDTVILCGTFVALLEILQAQTAIGSRGKPIFQAILGSDCFRFLIIAAIEAYKLANTTDPTALLGTLPTGNTGFQHVIDNLKVILMTANLFAPAAVAKVVVSVNSNSPSKSDSRNGPSSANVTVTAPGPSLKADSAA
ncbi:hypothetical protein DFJ73DRAFT_858646 [Zopfochytrium polystomum]|nr:hypothetical protein DFJ73DRAFT_858646 [Zopfochytrium polystomum]